MYEVAYLKRKIGNIQLIKISRERIGFNPIPTRQGRNQPLYESHVTKSGRNRVKDMHFTIMTFYFFSRNYERKIVGFTWK